MNSTSKNKQAVVIGRWQLPHKGHFALIRKAFDVAQDVIVVVGSSLRARDPMNPFTWQERVAMLRAGFASELSAEQAERVRFLPVRDYANDARWCAAVRAGVQRLSRESGTSRETIVVGHEKDSTSYYLKLFQPWGLHKVAEKFDDLDATPLRNVFFGPSDTASALSVLAPMAPAPVLGYLQAWAQLPHRARIAEEKGRLEQYRARWPFRVAVTADAVVSVNTPSGRKVLLVRRNGDIGQGLWAVPGGFMESDERTMDTALRELEEETGLQLWGPQASELLKGSYVAEAPGRSLRGRIISHVYHFDLGDHKVAPEVRVSSEASRVAWVDVAELPAMLEFLFEDHALILEHFFGSFDEAVAPRLA